MKPHLDMNRIARGLRAERKGKGAVGGGYFGAMQLLADIEARFRVPAGGGRATDPDWTERRLVPLAPRTLKRLEAITEDVRARSGVSVEPMQIAALLLERRRPNRTHRRERTRSRQLAQRGSRPDIPPESLDSL
jgi:hypothetical protein